jgi:ribonuclease VapC
LIVVDTSAIMAILNGEPEAAAITDLLSLADDLIMAAPTKFELLMVAVGRKEEPGRDMAEALLAHFNMVVAPWTDEHARLAADAFLRFGKGRHRAALNFGDCMSYALAKSVDAPLLFKGNDFAETDVKAAL